MFTRIIFCGALLLLTGSICPAQNTYEEIGIYRSLVEREARDSTYQKALAAYGQTVFGDTVRTVLRKRLAELERLPEATDEQLRTKIASLERFAAEAARKKDPDAGLSALSEAFQLAFWREPKDFDKAFVLAVRLEKQLNGVTDDQFPGRRKAYVGLGEAYYLFRDFDKSVELLRRVMDGRPLSFGDDSRLEALCIAGICYANMPGALERSDSCFMAVMRSPDMVLGRPVYNAKALSYLGCNAMIKGEFDKALALDLEVLPRLKQETDYGHIAGMYACQGFCRLGKGDYAGLRMVIDSISAYAHRDVYNRNKRLKQAYTLNARYYSAVGDARTAQLYNDSLVSVYRAEEGDYTSQFISRARRQVAEEEIQLHRRQIAEQRQLLFGSSALTVILLAGITVILRLYRKKNAAYKALARKANEWARNPSPTVGEDGDAMEKSNGSTNEERYIMSLAEREMISAFAHREPGLTIESLADRIGVHRNTLSHAINRVTGGNFKQYVNGYRIKEAIRIISENEHRKLYIDELYERVGYSNRSSFYRVFKQFTGLSPAEFQKISNHEGKNPTSSNPVN